MMGSAWSVVLRGLDGVMVEVETTVGGGKPGVTLVGLPDAAVHESKERVKAAIRGAGLPFPDLRLTINLTPAGLPKQGTHYDLAIAAATLTSCGVLVAERVRRFVFLGELGLDGRVRRVRGLLPALLSASRAGFEQAVVPAAQAGEASLVPGLVIWPISHLGEVVDVTEGRPTADVAHQPEPDRQYDADRDGFGLDLADVHGHPEGRWVLEVAAAGRHHLFLHGAPGGGKTMLASRLPGILPDLEADEAIEVSAIHSLADKDLGSELSLRPPFSDPHHNATMASLIGGGRDIRPGAISLAHRGVLFLDEAPEFGTRLLDALRTPLENGWVTIARANQQVRYPAHFQLVLAANPCGCGKSGVVGQECKCEPRMVRTYQERLSGPMLDRIDIRHQILPLKRSFLGPVVDHPEPSAAVRERVLEARARQERRLAGTPWRTNGEVPGSHLRKLPLPPDTSPLERALARGTLSARGIDKVLRLAWTISDLAGRDLTTTTDLRVAMRLRLGELVAAA